MTYKHKRGKCAKETKEILEDVLLSKEEEYECIDCTESIHVRNPFERIVNDEKEVSGMKSQEDLAMEEAREHAEHLKVESDNDLGSYQPPEKLKMSKENGAEHISDKEKKKRAYVEFKKDYRG